MNRTSLIQKIKGPVFSIVTPFKENDDIDFESLERYLDHAYNSGARAFYVMGYNSRYSQLSWDEIKELNGFVSKKIKSLNKENLMIVADPLHCSTKVSLEFALHAQEVGADIISIICRERYYSDDQIVNHFNYVAERSDIGILVHEMPFLNGYGGPPVNYPISLLDQLADIPNVVAIKEDAKDDEYSDKVINLIKDRVGIVISGGGKRQWLRFADKGCQAWLNGIGVFEPKLAAKFWQFYQEGKKEKYMQIIEKVEVPFFEQGVQKYGWHLTIKAALEHQGWMHRRDRLPLQELSEKDALSIRTLLDSLPIKEVCD